ncbi:LysR family transcriptional regulator [Georgenia yuyongxinii]|uniref:LysR family transcriptional regulator n=1 Tax=Georgenia yuyongxinii TaxID=2589797 RepID=A0A5B8C092_9MICO|nr:LysR substrate-binding domain-containing protein [Georgenia yuyongxinii]QDC24109.1 LysR family transcriptional regulator [Georgenia yuyongxinii]
MDIDPRRLGFLLAVSRSGGVLAAADSLRLSASAVSQQIARLESEAGVKVLDRQPTGATLTAAGRLLAETAERIESEVGEARRALAALEGDISGVVVVGAFQTAIRAVLVPLLAELEQTLPGVDLFVHELAEEHGRRALRRGELDLLVIEHDLTAPTAAPQGTRDVPFLDEPWMIALPASDPTPSSLLDLAGATWLAPEPGGASDRALRRLATELSFTPRTAHRYQDFDVSLAMVAAGLGVALVPQLALRRQLPENVQWVGLPGLGNRHLFIRHRATRTEPRAATLAVLEQMIQVAANLEPF